MSFQAFHRAAPAALLAALAAPNGADVNFPNFSNPQNLTTVGSTATGGGYLLLTPNSTLQAGAAWYGTKQLVAQGFDTTFEFRMTPSNGSDGLALVIQNDSGAAIGNCGSSMGFSAGVFGGCATGANIDIQEALAVSIDVRFSPSDNDPDGNHVAVHVQQNSAFPLADHNNSLGSFAPSYVLDTGQLRTCRVAYDGGQTLDVYIDDLTSPLLTVTANLSQLLSLDNGTAWVGFTGASGNYAMVHGIKSWTFTESSGYLAGSTDQLSLSGGGKCDFTLSAGGPFAGEPYLLLGCHSGTSPGIPIDATQTLPLNPDAYFYAALGNPNTPPLTGSFGWLDPLGKGMASFTLPAGVNPAFAGIAVHHAFVAIDTTSIPSAPHVGFTSGAATFTFVP